MILDIGCGNHPKGTHNVDLYLGETEHRWKRLAINKDKIPNLLNADAQHLPFVNNVFDVCYSAHVLEHVQDFDLMIYEMERVAKKKVIIIVPYLFFGLIFGMIHKQGHVTYFLTPRTFEKRGYYSRVRIRWIHPELARLKKFPLPIYPIFEVVSCKESKTNFS